MAEMQFAAQAYQTRSTQLLSQQCINAFVEPTPKEGKTTMPVYGIPGLSLFARMGNGPILGMHIMDDNLFILSGSELWTVTYQQVLDASAGTPVIPTFIGSTNLGGLVSMADNAAQLVMVDGSAGWIYQPGGLNQVTTATVSPFTSLTATVGGTPTTADVLSLVATSSGVTGSPVTASYTVTSLDTDDTIALGLAGAVNNSAPLVNAGISASAAGAVVTLSYPTALTVMWASTLSSGATETITLTTPNPTGATTVPANITGTITSGDTLQIPLDNGAIFTTTAAQTVGPLDPAIIVSTPIPSQVTAGAIIIDTFVTLARIEADAFMPAATVRYFDGYFIFNVTGGRQFFLSGINDGTQYSGLDFATASAGSDNTMAVEVWHEQLLVLCQQHTEIWWDAGAAIFPFQRYDAAFIARGLASALCVCSEDNTVFWMGDDGIFYRLNNYNPQRISTFAMEHAWAQYPLRFTDASCFVLDQEGHKFIVVNFPSGCGCWCYDIGSQLWHERQSFGTPWV